MLTRIGGTGPDLTATVDRAADWRSVGVMGEFPDHSAVVAYFKIRGGDQFLTVIAPLDGSPPTLHHGTFAGFVLASDLATPADGRYAAPAESMPTTGRAYPLPSLDALIADGLFEASSTAVLGKGSHDAVPGDTAVHSYAVNLDRSSAAAAFYLQCIGPSSATVRWLVRRAHQLLRRRRRSQREYRCSGTDHGRGDGRHVVAGGHLLAIASGRSHPQHLRSVRAGAGPGKL